MGHVYVGSLSHELIWKRGESSQWTFSSTIQLMYFCYIYFIIFCFIHSFYPSLSLSYVQLLFLGTILFSSMSSHVIIVFFSSSFSSSFGNLHVLPLHFHCALGPVICIFSLRKVFFGVVFCIFFKSYDLQKMTSQMCSFPNLITLLYTHTKGALWMWIVRELKIWRLS